MKLLGGLIFLGVLFTLSGCLDTRKLTLNTGNFEVTRPPVINGASRELSRGGSNEVSADFSYGKDKKMVLKNVDDSISYDINTTALGLQYKRIQKISVFMLGGGAGLFPYPHLYGIAGLNFKNFEIGLAPHWGVSYNDAKYTGVADWGYWGDEEDTSEEVDESTTIWNIYAGLSFYFSLFINDFAFNYSGSLTYPWYRTDQLPVTLENGPNDDYDIDFDFPYIMMQSFGFAYTINNKYQIELAALQIMGDNLSHQTWAMDVKFSYIF